MAVYKALREKDNMVETDSVSFFMLRENSGSTSPSVFSHPSDFAVHESPVAASIKGVIH